MDYLPAQRLKLYRNFKAIDAVDYHGIVRFFERFEDGIRTLDDNEYFDCAFRYTEALFEIGQYGKNVVMCDHLLELVMAQNIEAWDGEDIYAKLLIRKAASLYRLGEYARSAHILREHVKIYPNDRFAVRFLYTCLTRQKPVWLSNTRAAAVGLAFLAVAAIALELFVVRPFFNDYYEKSLVVHNFLLGVGIFVLAGGEFRHVWLCRRAARSLARAARARQAQKDMR